MGYAILQEVKCPILEPYFVFSAFFKRNRMLHDHFHKVRRVVVEWCANHDVGTLVIGYNMDWKQKVKLGKKTNQNFVQLPFKKLIHLIQYKAEEQGLQVMLQEENHTSKCSFLDQEPIAHHEKYMGRRTSRGLFKSANGILINADVNGGYNIIRKAIPNAFTVDGIEGVGLHPERWVFFPPRLDPITQKELVRS